jgi:hypothetical protein
MGVYRLNDNLKSQKHMTATFAYTILLAAIYVGKIVIDWSEDQ